MSRGRLLEPSYWKKISSLGRLPCQQDLRKIRSAAITTFTVSYSGINLTTNFVEKYYTMSCNMSMEKFYMRNV